MRFRSCEGLNFEIRKKRYRGRLRKHLYKLSRGWSFVCSLCSPVYPNFGGGVSGHTFVICLLRYCRDF